MPRVAFTLRLHAGMVDAYVARHDPVWPEMLAEIAAAGRRDYSLFLDRTRSEVFGYYETDDDEAARAYLASSPVAARWEASMSPFFVDLDGRADRVAPLIEIFNLHDQLADLDAGTEHGSTPS